MTDSCSFLNGAKFAIRVANWLTTREEIQRRIDEELVYLSIPGGSPEARAYSKGRLSAFHVAYHNR